MIHSAESQMIDQYNKIVLLDKLCSNSLTSFSLFDFGDSPGLESRCFFGIIADRVFFMR